LKIHLLRHAKTEALSPSGKDVHRELNAKGKRQVAEMKLFLSKKDWGNTTVLCSAAVRTQQTLKLLALASSFHKVTITERLYLAESTEIENYIASPESQDIFIIGHNNGLSDFAQELINEPYLLKTCSYLEIEVEGENWSEFKSRSGKIISHFHPEVD
jgi:phosphohistidine phosphatase